MKVSYNNFSGELVKLERKVIDPKSLYIDSIPIKFCDKYELQIFTPEKRRSCGFYWCKFERRKNAMRVGDV